MPDHWNVLPVSPEIITWLHESGLHPRLQQTRYPTLDELLGVLQFFNLPVEVQKLVGDTLSITLGPPGTAHNLYLLGDRKGDGFAFQFEGSPTCQPLILKILKKLCQTGCQELVIYESTSAIPCLVDADTEVDDALKTWQTKIDEYAGLKISKR